MTDLEIKNIKTQLSLLEDINRNYQSIFYGFEKQVTNIIDLFKNKIYDNKEEIHKIAHKDYVKIIDAINGLKGLNNLRFILENSSHMKTMLQEIEIKKEILSKLQ